MKNFKSNSVKLFLFATFVSSSVYLHAYVPLPPMKIDGGENLTSASTVAPTSSALLDRISIYVPTSGAAVYLTITDETGNIVCTTLVNSSTDNHISLDMTEFPSGTYIVTETNSNGTILYETILMVP